MMVSNPANDYPDWHPASTGAQEEKPGEGIRPSANTVGRQYTGENAPFSESSKSDRRMEEEASSRNRSGRQHSRNPNTQRKKGFRKPPAKYLQNSPFAPAFGAAPELEDEKKGSHKPAKTTQFRPESRLAQPDTEEDLALYALHGVGTPDEAKKPWRRGAAHEPESEFTKAKNIVLNQLAASAKSRVMLEKKLRDKEISEETIVDVLDRFEAAKLINDQEFAQMYVREKVTFKKLSRSAIARELKSKGVAEEHVAEALEQRSEEDERSDAHQLVAKKMRPSMDFSDRKEKEKIMRRLVGMLARKGYPPSMAFSVVSEEIENYVQENGGRSAESEEYYF
ncbi:regulatory protein RecX [Rothia sp. ZJ932]|uniref:regulatory protein RecX n=1 Tax=Rothia sp. ZJ932 TaxID=2810516 RepID=UPI001F0845B5|nr:regulatory protein RecX [Rothia sp. ZJ932]